jgi:PAS domain-containing protein
MKRGDGTAFWAMLTILPFEYKGEPSLLEWAYDISDRKQAEAEMLDKNRFIELLQQISSHATNAATVDAALQICLDEICRNTGWPVGHAYLHQPENDYDLISSKVFYMKDPGAAAAFRKVTEITRFRRGEGLPGRVLASKEPAWIVDVNEDRNFPRAKMVSDIGVKAGFAFPVTDGEKILVVLEFFSEEAVELDQRTLDVLGNVGRQLGSVIKRKQAEEALANEKLTLEAILQSLDEGVLLLNENLVIRTINDRVYELSGLSPGSIGRGNPVADIVRGIVEQSDCSEEEIENTCQAWIEQLSEFVPTNMEIRTADGRTLELVGLPIGAGDYAIVFRDITAGKNSRRDLT